MDTVDTNALGSTGSVAFLPPPPLADTNEYEMVIFAAVDTPVHEVMYFLTDNNIPFKVLLGCYKGQRETSFAIPEGRFADVVGSGIIDNEESVLLCGKMQGTGVRKADILFNKDQDVKPLGVLRAVQRSQAEAMEAWTFDPQGENWFVITDE